MCKTFLVWQPVLVSFIYKNAYKRKKGNSEADKYLKIHKALYYYSLIYLLKVVLPGSLRWTGIQLYKCSALLFSGIMYWFICLFEQLSLGNNLLRVEELKGHRDQIQIPCYYRHTHTCSLLLFQPHQGWKLSTALIMSLLSLSLSLSPPFHLPLLSFWSIFFLSVCSTRSLPCSSSSLYLVPFLRLTFLFSYLFFLCFRWYSTLLLIYFPSLLSLSLSLSLSLPIPLSAVIGIFRVSSMGLFSVKLLNVSQLRAINRGCKYPV